MGELTMGFFTWLRPLKERSVATRRDRTRRPAASGRLFLERLEDRTVPSTFTVQNLNDDGAGSLRAAVAAPTAHPAAARTRFAAGLQGTILLASELSVPQALTIAGPGANEIPLSGGGAARVFRISGATTEVTITGLTIANGRASGATFD